MRKPASKIIVLFFIFTLSLSLSPQQIFKEETVVINIEVPVRVFDKNVFIDNLTINDFQVLEDGIPQRIEAVYLVKKRSIERSEEKKRFVPQTSRNFYLFFEISEFSPRLSEALNYFTQNVLLPGDNLSLITPLKTYKLKKDALALTNRNSIAEQMKKLLRKDTSIGNSEYRNTLNSLFGVTRSLANAFETGASAVSGEGDILGKELDAFDSDHYEALDIDQQLILYSTLLDKLEILRTVEQMKLEDVAKFLKYKDGQKYVFLFYQKEFIPQVDTKILNQFLTLYQDRPDINQIATGLFDFYKRETNFDVDRIKKVYADSSISIHFLTLSTIPRSVYGVRMEEHTEDIYSSFKQIAQATGGITDTSSNPTSSFKRALDASENYYLLYYSPKEYTRDEKFREIEVKVKNKDYKIFHRLGYYSN